jgi:hypothetical protein
MIIEKDSLKDDDRNQSLPVLIHFADICLEVMRKTMKIFSQDNRILGRDSEL